MTFNCLYTLRLSFSWKSEDTVVSASSVRVRAQAGGIALCSWARHFTLTVPLSTQVYVYKWVQSFVLYRR